MEKKIKKITLLYEDGSSKSLVGEYAIEWLEKINGMCSFMENRNANPFKYFDYSMWLEETPSPEKTK